MAGVDKMTTMRRLIIAAADTGHIMYEGVDIEGRVLLYETFSEVTISLMSLQNLIEWVKSHNDPIVLGDRQKWRLYILDADETIDVRDLREYLETDTGVTDLQPSDSKPSTGISKAHKAANTKEMEG